MKKILSIIVAIMMLVLGVLSVSANSESDADLSYEGKILERLNIPHTASIYYEYKELYRSYEKESEVPEYVLVFLNTGEFSPAHSCGVFEDYIVREQSVYDPYELGYYIYIPAEDVVYTLREAWNLELDNIEKSFAQGYIGELIGDVDGDKKLTVKDATSIQKSLVGITQPYERNDAVNGIYDDETVILEYISDLNLDGERNIKDATAIQKKIAGLPY